MATNLDESKIILDTGELSTDIIPPNFTDPDVLFDVLIKTVSNYHPSSDLEIIRKAYALAKDAHKDQKRKSGEPYLIHPVCVGIILAQLELDKESIVAGLLHDVVEDTEYTTEDLTEMFSAEIAALVDGVTKLTQLNYAADKVERQAENLRKMFLAMAKDIRVILIKLADRLHNMRTLQFMNPEKQKEKARETMEIYAPIAERLGISKVKVELDDLSLQYLQQDIYKDLVQQLDDIREDRVQFVSDIVKEVKKHIETAGIEAEIDGRAKHLFSIYKKMKNQDKSLNQIYDLFAVRIIVDTDQQCYAALGVIHEMFTPIPGRFKDYIAMPKPNNYQSLHTTLIGPNGQPFEIQIRTYEMHRTAEYGIAAHWKYKESGGSEASNEEEKMVWLRQILEWQHEMSDNKEFLNILKSDLDLFSDSVYCFTPGGDVKTLPAGSTPIDFAYAVHSAVGNRMVGARVNGNLVHIDYKIQNGDQIEIMTSQNSHGPSRDWLNICASTQAKNKINQWFKSELKEENITKGKEMLVAYCKAKGIAFSDYLKPVYVDACVKKYGFRDWDSVCAAVGHGGLKEGQVVNKLRDEFDKRNKRVVTDEQVLEAIESSKHKTAHNPAVRRNSKNKNGGVVVMGMEDLVVRFTKCCSPVPGDEIVGFITRGRGVSVHRTDCVNIVHLPEKERNRIVEAWWDKESMEDNNDLYPVEIVIYAYNRTGVILDISKVFAENDIDMKSMNVRVSKQDKATIEMGFETRGIEQLNKIVKKLRGIESIIDIDRRRNG